jgi:hypothetical protein
MLFEPLTLKVPSKMAVPEVATQLPSANERLSVQRSLSAGILLSVAP